MVWILKVKNIFKFDVLKSRKLWKVMWDWGKYNFSKAAAAAKSLQSCPALCHLIDGNPRGSPIPGILQARTLEWVTISFSSAWKWKVKVKTLSRIRLLVTPWTVAYQAPLSMGFSRQEYWSELPLPSPFQRLKKGKLEGERMWSGEGKKTNKQSVVVIQCETACLKFRTQLYHD